jgi:hypothetical protein
MDIKGQIESPTCVQWGSQQCSEASPPDSNSELSSPIGTQKDAPTFPNANEKPKSLPKNKRQCSSLQGSCSSSDEFDLYVDEDHQNPHGTDDSGAAADFTKITMGKEIISKKAFPTTSVSLDQSQCNFGDILAKGPDGDLKEREMRQSNLTKILGRDEDDKIAHFLEVIERTRRSLNELQSKKSNSCDNLKGLENPFTFDLARSPLSANNDMINNDNNNNNAEKKSADSSLITNNSNTTTQHHHKKKLEDGIKELKELFQVLNS